MIARNNVIYMPSTQSTRNAIQWVCYLTIAIILHLVFSIGWLDQRTNATIDIIKNPTAISIVWSGATSAPTVTIPPKRSDPPSIIHRKTFKESANKIQNNIPLPLDASSLKNSTRPITEESVIDNLEAEGTSTASIDSETVSNTVEDSVNDSDASAQQNQKSEGSQQAVSVSGSHPKYPRSAIRRQQEGRVVVALTINEFGKTEDVKVLYSSGYYLLDQSVIRFAKQGQFHPATRNNAPVSSKQEFSFIFTLNE